MNPKTEAILPRRVSERVAAFTAWLDRYGETSYDHQSFFAGAVGRTAKSLYYRNRLAGTAAVAPMIFFEAFLPSARRMFHHKTRFPIADAHYSMGFAYLYQTTGDRAHLDRAVHFLRELVKSRSKDYKEYCWGYPFDWVTRTGTIARDTPFITSLPYVFEAFYQVNQIEARDEWRAVLESIARHAYSDIKDVETSATASTCSYSPLGVTGVINAAAYRAFLLTCAGRTFNNDTYLAAARRNLSFVIENQNANGSWNYAMDGVRDFVDHFHTCFVMKALGKIHTMTGDAQCLAALKSGVQYYREHLFDEEGLPKPFSRAPRMTVYKRELYDCAECINLCLVLKKEFPELNANLESVVRDIVTNWVKSDGSFRSRKLYLGWDNVPMHRWAQSQMFRSLAYFLHENTPGPEGLNHN